MKDFSKKKWQPKNYLSHYYSSDRLVHDEVLIFKYIYKFLSRFGKENFIDFLDFGSGPTVHRLIPFADYVKNIYVADYLSENLKEVDAWLENRSNAHNWDGQIGHILEIEYQNQRKVLKNPQKIIQQRKGLLRKKIKALLKCDVYRKNPLFRSKKNFDIVVSFYSIDSITSSKVKWYKATKNLLKLVKPGGWVIISALRSTKHYVVDSSIFPSPEINEKDFLKVFAQSKFDVKSVNVKIISAKLWLNSGIKSLMIISAQKLKAL